MSSVIFCAGPSVITTVSGDWDIALGSIIVPVQVNCRVSWANAAMLVRPTISGTSMIVRNIDKAPVETTAPTVLAVDRGTGKLQQNANRSRPADSSLLSGGPGHR